MFLIVGYLLIPHFMKLPFTSAYQILEARLGFKVRLLGSMIFLLIRLIWMSLIIYMCADKVLVVVLGWPAETTPYICAFIGLITVFYTTIGGLRAVVITDVLQSFILFGGALLTVLIVTIRMGGFGWFPTESAAHWARPSLFSLDPTIRLTVFGAIFLELLWWICTAGSDQMAIQRYLATRDAKTARRSFLVAIMANVFVRSFLAVVGFALLGYYSMYEKSYGGGATVVADADKLFTRFISHALPVGVAGLVISGLLASAMSALSSGINSVSAVISADFIDPIRKSKLNETSHVKLVRLVALCVGFVVILTSTQMHRVSGNLVDVTFKTCNLFVAPLFSLFFMAIFVRFATPFGATMGALYGLAAALLVGYWDAITGQPGVGIQWYTPLSLFASIAVGCLLSLIPTRGKSWKVLLTLGAAVSVPLFIEAFYVIRAILAVKEVSPH